MGLDHRPWWWLPLLGKGSGRDAIGTALVIIGGYLSFVWVFLYCYRIGFIINYRKATFPRVRRARKVTERPSRMKCPILRESIKNHHERFIPFGCPWSLFRSCSFSTESSGSETAPLWYEYEPYSAADDGSGYATEFLRTLSRSFSLKRECSFASEGLLFRSLPLEKEDNKGNEKRTATVKMLLWLLRKDDKADSLVQIYVSALDLLHGTCAHELDLNQSSYLPFSRSWVGT